MLRPNECAKIGLLHFFNRYYFSANIRQQKFRFLLHLSRCPPFTNCSLPAISHLSPSSSRGDESRETQLILFIGLHQPGRRGSAVIPIQPFIKPGRRGFCWVPDSCPLLFALCSLPQALCPLLNSSPAKLQPIEYLFTFKPIKPKQIEKPVSNNSNIKSFLRYFRGEN